MLKVLDKWGGPETYPHMAAGWAVAFDTPYKWTKQVALRPRRHQGRHGGPLADGHDGQGRAAHPVHTT